MAKLSPAQKETKKAKDLVNKDLKAGKIKVKRSFKQKGNRGHGKVSAEEKAEMARVLIEEPDITTREFSKRFGYKVPENGTASQAGYRMMKILQNEIAKYEIPEMEDVVKADLIILGLAQREQMERIAEDPKSLQMSDLVNASNTSFKRARLMSGGSTEKVEVNISVVDGISEESELDDMLDDLVVVKEVKKG